MHFAENGKWDEYDKAVTVVNVKKTIVIPWSEVANICYDYGGVE